MTTKRVAFPDPMVHALSIPWLPVSAEHIGTIVVTQEFAVYESNMEASSLTDSFQALPRSCRCN
jgi:hypothetical protein